MVQAKHGDTVTVHYTGSLPDGTVFDSSVGGDPLQFSIGGGQIIPGFEHAVIGMAPGDSKTQTIPSEQAYGPHYDEMVVVVNRGQIPNDVPVDVGQQLQLRQPGGQMIPVVITNMTAEEVTLDANHPLAGEDLIFKIELVSMAQAKHGDTATVHYTGSSPDGTVLDSSVESDPLQFSTSGGQIISGFEQAITGMAPSDSKTQKIPSEQAYNPHIELVSMAQAKHGDTVTVHYTGSLPDGTVFDSSVGGDPLQFSIGGGQIIPGFEHAVIGMAPGDSKTQTIPAEQAYGPRYDEMIVVVNREQIPSDVPVGVGQQLQLRQPGGQMIPVVITNLTEEEVTLDANHPLAGEDLVFEIELVSIT